MKEGWFHDNYLILFEEPEIPSASNRYRTSELLPGYEVVGLRGWDDLIVRNASGQTYCVPTVPMDQEHLSPFSLGTDAFNILTADKRFTGKIKWYVQPVVFAGDPRAKENMIWVDHQQHAALVNWWNQKYRELKRC